MPGALAPDGEALDAYLIGIDMPVKESTGTCIAVIHRFGDDDDKLVVTTTDVAISDAEITSAVAFQEISGAYEIRRG